MKSCQNLTVKLSKTFTNTITKSFGVSRNHTKDSNFLIIGTTTGGVTLNSIIVGVLNRAGVLVANIGKMKNYNKKVEMSRIAFTTYEKVLVELRSALRGDSFDKNEFIDKMKIMNEIKIYETPLADRFVKKYNRKFEKNKNNITKTIR